MPLPAALQERLKQRGIIQDNKNEEVFAENYDSNSSDSEVFIFFLKSNF